MHDCAGKLGMALDGYTFVGNQEALVGADGCFCEGEGGGGEAEDLVAVHLLEFLVSFVSVWEGKEEGGLGSDEGLKKRSGRMGLLHSG